VAVEPDWRRKGLAGELIARACEAARAAGEALVMLVGDLPLFVSSGFEPVPAGGVILPGPVDYRRVLWRPLVPGAAEGVSGEVAPAG
jgi:predicted N-acetyltransferase YhbS